MKRVSKYYSNKATVCTNRTCVTVYGEAAKIISGIAICAAALVAIAYVAKAFSK
jgi:hypothetical protein